MVSCRDTQIWFLHFAGLLDLTDRGPQVNNQRHILSTATLRTTPAVKNSRLVAFDDFYLAGVDIEKFGCNAVVKDLPHRLLPHKDKCKGGIVVQMAVVG